MGRHEPKTITVVCEVCGKAFTYDTTTPKLPRRFCSDECRAAHNRSLPKPKPKVRAMVPQGGDRTDEIMSIGKRIGQMALEGGMSRNEMLSLAGLITQIAEMAYRDGRKGA